MSSITTPTKTTIATNTIPILLPPSSSYFFSLTTIHPTFTPPPHYHNLSPSEDDSPTASYYTPRKLTWTLALGLLIGGFILLLLCLGICIFGYVRHRKRVQAQNAAAAVEAQAIYAAGIRTAIDVAAAQAQGQSQGLEHVLRMIVVPTTGEDGQGRSGEGGGGVVTAYATGQRGPNGEEMVLVPRVQFLQLDVDGDSSLTVVENKDRQLDREMQDIREPSGALLNAARSTPVFTSNQQPCSRDGLKEDGSAGGAGEDQDTDSENFKEATTASK